MTISKVPFLDLNRQHEPLRAELTHVLSNALTNSAFVGGESVSRFEESFANYVGTTQCAGVNSGTDAIRFALMALGVKAGDAVITTPHTFIATTEAISQVGAKIQFVDVEESTGLMDLNLVEKHLHHAFTKGTAGPRPKVILPVHLYGQCVDMDGLNQLARRYDLRVLEDACQAHGATYKKKSAGSLADMSAFSFYPGKNLGALGEGGAVCANDKDLIGYVKVIRDHGQREKYHHSLEGYNGRLDAIQAAFLSVKLPHLEAWNAARRKIAGRYHSQLANLKGIQLPFIHAHNVSNFHLYVAHVADPKGMNKFMLERGVGCGYHYPIPLHLQACYQDLGFHKGAFPVCEKLSSQLISLPMFPTMTEEETNYVCAQVQDYIRSQPV